MSSECDDNFIYIKNSSSTDRCLFFRIKRSEPKVVSYEPKKGIVEPGATFKINIKLLGNNVSAARILVQLVAVKRADLSGVYADDWSIGSRSGMVSKIVDIRRKGYALVSNEDSFCDASQVSNLSQDAYKEGKMGFNRTLYRLKSTAVQDKGLVKEGSTVVIDTDEDVEEKDTDDAAHVENEERHINNNRRVVNTSKQPTGQMVQCIDADNYDLDTTLATELNQPEMRVITGENQRERERGVPGILVSGSQKDNGRMVCRVDESNTFIVNIRQTDIDDEGTAYTLSLSLFLRYHTSSICPFLSLSLPLSSFSPLSLFLFPPSVCFSL